MVRERILQHVESVAHGRAVHRSVETEVLVTHVPPGLVFVEGQGLVSDEHEAVDSLQKRILQGDATVEGVYGRERGEARLAPVAAGRPRARHDAIEFARLGGEVDASGGEVGDERARATHNHVEGILVSGQDAGGLVHALRGGERRQLTPVLDVAFDEFPVEAGVLVRASRVGELARLKGQCANRKHKCRNRGEDRSS